MYAASLRNNFESSARDGSPIDLQKSGGNVIDHKNHLVALSVVRHLLIMIAKISAREVTTEDRLRGAVWGQFVGDRSAVSAQFCLDIQSPRLSPFLSRSESPIDQIGGDR